MSSHFEGKLILSTANSHSGLDTVRVLMSDETILIAYAVETETMKGSVNEYMFPKLSLLDSIYYCDAALFV